MSMRKYGKWIATAVVLIVALTAFILSKVALPYGDEELVFDDPAQTYVKIHVLDVGQADAIIAELPGHRAMLIDAATSDQSDKIIAYLNKLSIKKIDFAVGTHPHEDHIGGLYRIMEVFPIEVLYMPAVENEFTDPIHELAQTRDVEIKKAKAGECIVDDGELRVEMLAPCNSGYEDINDYSAVVKITYVNNTFLFTGDATALSEREMIVNGAALDVDVLKIGHHGAESSTCGEFLSAVSPRYAVISVAENNPYGFPSASVKERLKEIGTNVYRTDRDGTVIFFGNGQRIGVKTEK